MGYIDANLLGEITVTIDGERFVRYEDAMRMECEKVVPIDRVLEIIEREERQADTVGMAEQYQRGYKDACQFVRAAVQALKEDKEE